jgi:hypothetical protein
MPSQFLIEKLKASGLDPADVDATDVYDFSGAVSGLKLPYYTPDGRQHPHMHRVRLALPPPGTGKYTQPSTEELVRAGHPASTATMPYLNPHILGPGGVKWDDVAKVAGKKLLIVEGELKAAAAGKMLQRFAIGIPGCEGGVRRNEQGVAHVHPMIRPLIAPGDLVEVVLDGDILTNPAVNRAAGTLKRAMGRFGVRPPQPGRGPGLDDWLMGMNAADHQRAFEALPRTFGEDFDEDWVSVADAFGLALNAKGTAAAPTISNLLYVLEKHERFITRYFFDLMRGNIYRNEPKGPQPFEDAFVADEQTWFQRKLGMAITKQTMLDALRWMAAQPRWQRNLLLEEIPAWDGTPRLEEMFIHGWGAQDSDYIRAVGKNWLVSGIARASVAGCKVDTMLVLVGPQGSRKSMSLEALAGGLYVATHSQVQDKDFIMALHRGWMIDLAELSSMNHSESNAVKGIITNAIDHIRPPYGAVVEEKKRRSVMVGTTNEERFLRDHTGNRRFWPVASGNIDIAWIKANRLQLLAEARTNYAAGQDWWTMPASTLAVQEARMEIGPWDAPLKAILSGAHNFRIVTVNSVSYRFITSEELMDALGIELRFRKSHMYRDLSASIKRIGGGWEQYFCPQRITLKDGGFVECVRGYRIPVTGNPTAKVININEF